MNKSGIIQIIEKAMKLNINVDNCDERGYDWHFDNYYDPEAPVEILMSTYRDVKNGYVIGVPFMMNMSRNGYYGFYKKITEDDIKANRYIPQKHITTDFTLTTETCDKRGYKWISDYLYDTSAPYEARKNFENDVINKKVMLGLPIRADMIGAGMVGIYKKK